MAPRGFQLYVSSDGAKWTQVGKDGFGASTTLWADVNVVGDAAYLSAFDYHAGSQLWRSTDGQNWELIFREPNPSFFSEGGGVIDFADHLLWMDNDLATGVEMWRSDAQVVADVTTTTGGASTSTTSGATVTTGSSTGVSSGGQTGTSTATGVTTGGTNGSVGTKEATSGGGLSGGWIALIAALAVLAVAALVAAAFLFGRVRGGGAATRGSTAANGSVVTDAGAVLLRMGKELRRAPAERLR